MRPALRKAFVDLCRKPVGDYLSRFDFKSDLLRAMYAVTDGFSGSAGTWSTPGTGMNFLVHNMCRLPGSDGTFMLVRGGMGTVTDRIADAARAAGATIETGRRVDRIVIAGGAARGVAFADGSELRAQAVVCNADPFRMRDLCGRSALPGPYNERIDSYARDGTTMKVNLALRGLPEFSCLASDAMPQSAYGPTIHLLPDEREVLASLERIVRGRASRDACPSFRRSSGTFTRRWIQAMKDERGRHNSALFVQWVPYALSGGKSWDREEDAYVKHLLSICDRFAPGTSDLVVDTMSLTPPKIEAHFGITRGHIHHVDNQFGFADRLPYATPIGCLYSCSAGTHPAGSVIGCAGHNAAMRVLRDFGRA